MIREMGSLAELKRNLESMEADPECEFTLESIDGLVNHLNAVGAHKIRENEEYWVYRCYNTANGINYEVWVSKIDGGPAVGKNRADLRIMDSFLKAEYQA